MSSLDDLPPVPSFVRPVHLAHVPGPSTPLLDAAMVGLAEACARHGHHWTQAPDARTDAFVTTARLHEPLSWRQSPLFVGRKQFGLRHKPATYAVVQATPEQLRSLLARFAAALARQPWQPADFELPGLAANGAKVLRSQGESGGPLVCVARLLQAQTKCLRILLLVGDQQLESAYLFDLAGARPRLDGRDARRCYSEAVQRMATQLSTCEATAHEALPDVIPAATWAAAVVPPALLRWSRELGQRRFFTELVRVADLVDVPVLNDALAQQYSEGCFASFDPLLDAQVITASGSLEPVAKSAVAEGDLAVLAAPRANASGVVFRRVEGHRNPQPSSEALEFELLDARLPRRVPPAGCGVTRPVPVVRSKLHGHRGVAAYDPRSVEFAPLAAEFHDYLVSCSTQAQALAIADAFARSAALHDPEDPRQVVFTILPGHGLLMVEKWQPGLAPGAVLLAAMDSGQLEVAREVPQGHCRYVARGARMVFAAAEPVRAVPPATAGGTAQ
ncbi:MAG: hypothetical protein JNK49_06640 [Planctomycetes bacterium]|nr:hypothetical protein [Planctomycetota bacterium]